MQAIPSGASLVASSYCSTPTTLLNRLGAVADKSAGLSLSAGLLLGDLAFLDAVRRGDLQFRTWHASGPVRALATSGQVGYLPARASSVSALVGRDTDVALIRVSPPDSRGRCSLGPSASYTKTLVESARIVIAEVDPDFPVPQGDDTWVSTDQIDYFMDSDTPMAEYPSSDPSSAVREIARHVVGLIPAGAHVQLGIGAVAEAVASELARSGPGGLRMIGLGCDQMTDLMASGQLISDGRPSIIAAELLGSEKIFSAAGDHPGIWLASSKTIHNPVWLASLPRLISVCSALAVDLSGQVASETMDGKVLAGIGGSADFFDGAGLSPGGVRIVALPSVTAKGISRIASSFGAGTAVTMPRHSVDVVITEHGVATLTGLSTVERALALANIAAPEHRPELLHAAGILPAVSALSA
ncbi:acetyl-CoA hydrolase/transferase family protein [Arthrobacter sp. AFG20]|uniref:acetyl-CoA hydrolase/transferase family protein n=1 Tax=Arthrobacter sp. AFG20 TaxID=1688671 RepID=UPI002155120A|nr:acetyl-CoA hydrolase/transferase C-terminal domain-containing protein [Arthrobacter sp. AFG20]